MTVAPESEMLAALVEWSKVFGCWMEWGDMMPARRPWVFMTNAVCTSFAIANQDDDALEHSPWTPTPAIALAWAILVESEPPPVDVGPCPECVARGGPMEWRQAVAEWTQVEAWRGYWEREKEGVWSCELLWNDAPTPTGYYYAPHRYRLVGSRSCPACSGTGRSTVSVPRLLLDATTVATAREALLVHADMLCAANDPAGLPLAWGLRWSAGDGGWDGTGEATMLVRWLAVARFQRCPTCNTKRGACCSRGCELTREDMERGLAPDPYAQDMHGDERLHLQCGECAFQSAQDI
jgi:hypothetical protein